MFTGIILSIGQVIDVQAKQGDRRLQIGIGKLNAEAIQLGDSVAVNGVCLTVAEKNSRGFLADVSNETLSLTTMREWKAGTAVNLELSLTPASRLGGHWVSGHVDGIGEVIKRWSDGRSERFLIKAPPGLSHYIAQKGSICVDGISLTVNSIDRDVFGLNIVPHTLRETIMGNYRAGCKVNLEVDIIARYLERLLLHRSGDNNANDASSGISDEFLQRLGFMNAFINTKP